MYQFSSRVRYSEVDSERNLTIPALLDYLQDCCTFQSEQLGVGVDYLMEQQAAWVLSSWEIRIYRRPRMGEQIFVGTWPYDFKGFYGYRNFTITGKDGEVLADANSVWVYMELISMRPAKIGDGMREAYLPDLGKQLGGEWSERKIRWDKTIVSEKKEPVRVARFFIDTNHHMNNGKYILVAEEYLPEGFEIGGLRAEYKKAAVSGDTIYPEVITEEKSVTVTLTNEGGVPYAVVQFIKAQD